MKVLSRLRHVILTGAMIALLWAMLVWLNETHEGIGAKAKATTVARLVDADTAFFVHVPNFNGAFGAFSSADFTKLGIHHGMSAIAKQVLRDIPELVRLSEHWNQCQAMNVTDVTLTITPKDGRLNVLTLFRSDTDADALWQSCVDWWKSDSDQAMEHIEERDGVRYRHLTDRDKSLVHTTWNGWHLASNNAPMIKRAITRLRTETPTNALSEQNDFQQSLVPLQSDYLVLSYVSSSKTEVSSQASKALQRFGKIQRYLDRLDARSAALTTTVRRGQMIEEAFVLTETPQPEETAQVQSPVETTLPLTSPQTLAYITSNVGSPRLRQFLLGQFMKRWEAAKIPALQQVAATWENCFTSTWAFQLEPIETLSTTEAMPENEPLAALLSFALNDEATAIAHLETLAQTEGSGIRRSSLQTYVLDHALLPSVLTNLLEEVHLHVEHGLLIIGDRVRGIHQVTRRWYLKQDLKQRSDFLKLASTLPKAETGLSFIDTERVLTRGSEALKHPIVVATLWMGLQGQTHLEVNLDQLGRALTSNLPITPTLATWQRTPHGYRESSIGTLSPLQWALGGGAIIAAIDKTFLDQAPLTETDNFASPAIEEELLRMMEP